MKTNKFLVVLPYESEGIHCVDYRIVEADTHKAAIDATMDILHPTCTVRKGLKGRACVEQINGHGVLANKRAHFDF